MSGFGPKVYEDQKKRNVFAAKTPPQIGGVMVLHHNKVSPQNDNHNPHPPPPAMPLD